MGEIPVKALYTSWNDVSKHTFSSLRIWKKKSLHHSLKSEEQSRLSVCQHCKTFWAPFCRCQLNLSISWVWASSAVVWRAVWGGSDSQCPEYHLLVLQSERKTVNASHTNCSTQVKRTKKKLGSKKFTFSALKSTSYTPHLQKGNFTGQGKMF